MVAVHLHFHRGLQHCDTGKIGGSLEAAFAFSVRSTSARGKRIARAAAVWSIILMGGLVAPAFAHAHEDHFQHKPGHETQRFED